ncbi:MAG: O-antigen ligase family protein [Terriglobales bacterium]
MPPHRRFWSRYALAASLAIPLLAVACLGSTSIAAWSWMAMLSFTALAILLVGATWGAVKLPWHPILWPATALGALILAQYFLGWTAYAPDTLDGLLQLTACACELYLALFAYREEANLKRAGTVLWLFSGALGAEALAQFFTAGGYIYWYRDARYATPVGPFIYHNHFAGCMDLLLPISVAVALRVRRRSRDQPWLARVRRGILPALALTAVVVSQSRGGLFTLVFECGLAAILFAPHLRRDPRLRRRALIGAAALVAFTLLAGWQPLLKRLANLEYHDVSAVYRARVAAACVAIWRDHPWLGTGFNTFAQVYPRYQTFDSGQQWDQAHNEYAQALAETGLLGILVVAGFIAVLATKSWQVNRRLKGGAAAAQFGALLGCAGFLFHSAGDFLFHAPGLSLLFFCAVGLATAPTSAGSPRLPPQASQPGNRSLAKRATTRPSAIAPQEARLRSD